MDEDAAMMEEMIVGIMKDLPPMGFDTIEMFR
jgi:hypothetical protein